MNVTPYKGREIYLGQAVQVYRNLHNGTWSLRDASTGLVVGHADEIVIVDPRFVVNEAGRERVRRERKKYVHAWVEGRIARHPETSAAWDRVTYNPYTHERFKNVLGDEVEAARWAWLVEDTLFVRRESDVAHWELLDAITREVA